MDPSGGTNFTFVTSRPREKILRLTVFFILVLLWGLMVLGLTQIEWDDFKERRPNGTVWEFILYNPVE
jgi:hypothetical protein